MPENQVLMTWTLWCADCDDEFTGVAMVTVHTVDEQGEPTNVTFAFAESPCPTNPAHRVGDPAERPGG
jgi:hypothetical protein